MMLKYEAFGKIVFFIEPMWGELRLFHVVLRISGTNFFKIGQIFFISHLTLLYLLKIDFSKFDPLTATGMALCVNLGPKCKNLFPLVSD
jgi:hypothetical protein